MEHHTVTLPSEDNASPPGKATVRYDPDSPQKMSRTQGNFTFNKEKRIMIATNKQIKINQTSNISLSDKNLKPEFDKFRQSSFAKNLSVTSKNGFGLIT